MKAIRLERIASFLRVELSQIIQFELNDPRVGFVTITRVKPTQDLKEATVFVSILGSEADQRKALRGLSAAAGFIQQHLSGRHSWRNTPQLRFELDESIEKSMSMDDLLAQAKAEDEASAEQRSQKEAE